MSEGAARKRVTELLTLAEVREKIEHWIVHEYHQRAHSETKSAPADSWQKSVVLPRMPESEDALNLLLLQDETRVVRAVGIDFRTRRYWSPALGDRIGTQIFLRFNPDDLTTVYVYCAETNEFIAEASEMGLADSRYGLEDVKAVRRRQDREWKDLLTRFKTDADLIAVNGRAPKRAQKRRTKTVQSDQAPTPTQMVGSTEPRVEDLLRQLERRLRSDDPGVGVTGGQRDAC
jgi:putative transposase